MLHHPRLGCPGVGDFDSECASPVSALGHAIQGSETWKEIYPYSPVCDRQLVERDPVNWVMHLEMAEDFFLGEGRGSWDLVAMQQHVLVL